MTTIETGSVVIVHCSGPREKLWGLLVRIDAVGAVVRGMDLSSVEDWIRQEARGEPPSIGPATFLVPTHRLVRVDLDESGPMVEGFADRYRELCGRDVRTALGRDPNPSADGLPA